MQKFVMEKSKMSKIYLPGILLTLVFLSIPSLAVHARTTAGQPNFTLKPTTFNAAVPATRSYFILNAQPSGMLSENVQVTNSGTVTGRVSVYPVTATTEQASGTAYLSKNDPLRDVAAWIHMNPQQLTLKPGQSQIIPFQVAVPAKSRPGDHLGGIIAENLAIQRSTTKGAVHIDLQQLTIIAVQIHVAGTAVDHMAVTDVNPGGSNGYQSLLVHMVNNGDTMLKPVGEINVSDAQGHVLQALPLKLDIIVPGTSINYPVYVQKKALAAGVYLVSIVLHYGKGKVLYYSTRLTVTQAQINSVFQSSAPLQAPGSNSKNSMPLWQILLVALAGIIVLLIIGQRLYGLLSARRRKQKDTPDEQERDTKKNKVA